VRFGRWEAALAEPEPPANRPFVRGVWHFARGMAFRAAGDAAAAEAELEALRPLATDPQVAELKIYEANSLGALLEIAVATLAGEMAALKGDTDEAVAQLERAIALDDGLIYAEPRDWPLPPRHYLAHISFLTSTC
jgi:tetratricopeptide (TPR) repeat protein